MFRDAQGVGHRRRVRGRLHDQLWFDVASIADRDITPDAAALLARRIRQVGVSRVLYGTDSAQGDNLRPVDAWAAFRRLPLTAAEFGQIASNEPPYVK